MEMRIDETSHFGFNLVNAKKMSCHRHSFEMNRRSFLGFTAGGLGYLALAHLMAAETGSAPKLIQAAHPLAPKLPLHRPRAKAVICLFQHGGPSQMDLFDAKPELNKWDGKDYPGNDLEIHFDKQAGKLLQSPFKFHQTGQTGMELCELIPHTARIADELTL